MQRIVSSIAKGPLVQKVKNESDSDYVLGVIINYKITILKNIQPNCS